MSLFPASLRRWSARSKSLARGAALAAMLGGGPLLEASGEGETPKPGRVDPGLEVAAASGEMIRPFECPPDGGKAAVVIFLSVDCPIANRYAPEIERIRAAYAGRGVGFTLVQVDPDLADAEALAHRNEFRLGALVAVDRRHDLVRAAGATVTPEVVAVDPEGKIRYRGRIDDQFADYGARRARAERRELREALDALLEGQPVAIPETEALGCYIPPLE